MIFQPLRERLQRAVNRLMYGERDEPYAVVTRLSQRLEATLAPAAVLPTIVETVAQALKLPYAAIEVTTADGRRRQNVSSRRSSVVRLPLVYQGDHVGDLLVAPRGADESFSPAEMNLLTLIAREAGTAVHAVQLTADLQRSREQLVTAREEERRRIRRDLHDGLGPALASLAMQADNARELVRADTCSKARSKSRLCARFAASASSSSKTGRR